MYKVGGIRFYRQELRDLAIAWVALAIAFTVFLEPNVIAALTAGVLDGEALARVFSISMLTVGTGFLLHELAHKVVAVRFGQIAAFRADYTMLAFAVAAGLAGFLFAAPGAVYHRGRITARQNGLVSVAGPITNLVLAVVFLVPFLFGSGFIGDVGRMGVIINIVLAVFNMVPFGPLDGKTVLDWNRMVFGAVLGVALAFGALFVLFGL